MKWMELCWDWLHKFETIYFFGDSDEAGREMIRKVANRLSELTIYDVLHECKDANELLITQGRDAVANAYAKAKEILPLALLKLAEVQPLDVKNVPSCPSGIKDLDRLIGGFIMGDLSVWTGKCGGGKSTFLGQLMLEAVKSGNHVCVYTGELGASRFQHWIDLQAAWPQYIIDYPDQKRASTQCIIDETSKEAIHKWYSESFWLYENTAVREDENTTILKVFEKAAQRYGCTVFLVDNLMTCPYTFKGESEYYRAQSTFVGQLVDFTRSFNVHVHLVAHPRKSNRPLYNDDISGSADIANRAANVFSLERLYDEDKNQTGCDAVLTILKNRWEGISGKIGLRFDTKSKRLYVPSQGNDWSYGWEVKQMEVSK